ncbi:unnamed protein product [Rotaria sordida]|uniref:Uncharacterized protein n=1 Tax=Rotaria sordida TaxID=392033 RepID=A0A815RP84_9BILA|nr:unnamed protein product [Rotaria sordida]CAF1479710.1 unnamed protein product [Rotaria sordida]CAF1566806.1 unnamed protein product [Rotaria sordida]CAF4151818.1 unnamed protein product [Rotaria sordida]
MMDYSLDDAILQYRKLFYSVDERSPKECIIDDLLDHIDRWTLNSTPVIIDYGGGFTTEHLHLIQYAFPKSMIYSVDILYEKLDLLVCNINEDETKWCFIPVFPRTGDFNQDKLIEHIRQELKGSTSVWNGIEIFELKFFSKIDHLNIYDPYSEILELKEINFIDTTEKCEIIPCSVFMAYYTGEFTPYVKSLKPEGLFDPIHTKVDMDNAYGERSRSRYIDRWNGTTTTINNGNTKWNKVHTHLNKLKSILPDETTIIPPERIPFTGWLNNNMISKHLNGQLSRNTTKSSFVDPLADSFGIKENVLSSVECLNLNSFLAENGIEFLTSSNVRQIIEQHVGGFWKNDDISEEKYPKNFVKDCLRELLGSVKNLHIHIDSYRSLLYSFEFVRQLKYEDPNLHIEFSLTDKVEKQSCQSAVILAFECNKNYVLVYVKLHDFLERITKCKPSEDIQQLIETSVAFTYDMSRGQQVKWHKNLSFIYVAAYQDFIIKQVQDRLSILGLEEMNFVSKQLEHVNSDESQQCHTSQAVICFQFHGMPSLDYMKLPLKSDQLDQWIFNKDTCKFTGPIMTLYPNNSKYEINEHISITPRTYVGSVYSSLCDDIAVLFQWRNS